MSSSRSQVIGEANCYGSMYFTQPMSWVRRPIQRPSYFGQPSGGLCLASDRLMAFCQLSLIFKCSAFGPGFALGFSGLDFFTI